jgi:hypothetical protein
VFVAYCETRLVYPVKNSEEPLLSLQVLHYQVCVELFLFFPLTGTTA